MIGLKDIKGIVEVPDNSLLIFIAIIIAIFFFLGLILYFLKTKRRKKLTQKEKALQELKTIDFSDTKKSVYLFSENFPYFLDDTNKTTFIKLQDKLIQYKYKKDVQDLTDEIIKEMKTMIRGIKK